MQRQILKSCQTPDRDLEFNSKVAIFTLKSITYINKKSVCNIPEIFKMYYLLQDISKPDVPDQVQKRACYC